MTSTDWGSLVEEANALPIWEGRVRLGEGVGSVIFWFQVWPSARFDLGFAAQVTGPESLFADIEHRMHELQAGLIEHLVLPAMVRKQEWSLESKPAAREEILTRPGRRTGVTYVRIRSKVIVRVPRETGRDLDELMTAINSFAQDQGWEGSKK